jgi:hypothetical protein
MKAIKGGFKAFGGGFCGCLGAWAASLLLISTLGFIVGSVAGPIVPIVGGALPQILQNLQRLPSGLISPPMPGGYGPGQPPPLEGGLSGPFQGPGAGEPPAGTPLPSQAESVEGWEIWLSKVQDPQAEKETRFAQADTIFIFVSGPAGAATQFQLILSSEMESRAIPIPFQISPDSNPVGCGAINAGRDMPPGAYRLGVVVGQEVMASTEFNVE